MGAHQDIGLFENPMVCSSVYVLLLIARLFGCANSLLPCTDGG